MSAAPVMIRAPDICEAIFALLDSKGRQRFGFRGGMDFIGLDFARLQRYCCLLAFFLMAAILEIGCGKKTSDESADGGSVRREDDVTFSPCSSTAECYDFVEVTLTVANPVTRNPFTDVAVSGRFRKVDQGNELIVDGFCDSPDGTIFRVRFMPVNRGDYAYSVTYRRGDFERVYNGTFKAVQGKRSSILRVDPSYPWHFIWEASGEHCFVNGTTAFLLMGWENEQTIRDCIDRLHSFKVNRIRVLLDGRTDHFWTEPIRPNHEFHPYMNPWEARRPADVNHPQFDYTRFNCAYWRKFERMVEYALEKGIIVSVIFAYNDTKVHPVADSDDERRYFRYAVARLAAFANITWDLGDDLDSFRSETWTHKTGMILYELDPYHHLATSHPVGENQPQDRTSQWFGMTSFQRWDRPLHGWMLEQRQLQLGTGRIIPQLNEEYGYEDHYPAWAPYKPPAASADNNRRAAWEISMAGCYQTTGETAKRGTGVAPDTGGGWVNGRGDDTMTMLKGYAHMVDFFTSFEWWKMDPHDELANNGAFCLAEIGSRYVVYLQSGGDVEVNLSPGRYAVKWFNPRNAEYSEAGFAKGGKWRSQPAPDSKDWVLLLERN
jgi:Protein of unknown function (DUF4038)/Domain of unknown function (DUF5060)/Putative collagen-binding domain of a collagenase